MKKTAPKIGPGSEDFRFFKMVRRETEASGYRPELGPCLIWIGADNGNGYGQFYFFGAKGYAHRYAWERENGAIPSGLTVDHLCRNRRCCEISHLELCERNENYLRGVRTRTECPNGHPYTKANGEVGNRRCFVCRQNNWRKDELRKQAIIRARGDARIKKDQKVLLETVAQIRRGEVGVTQASRNIEYSTAALSRKVWRVTKKDVFDRDGNVCFICGGQAQDVHHRKPRGSGGTSDYRTNYGMSNLISLCRDCHSHAELNRLDALSKGHLISRNSTQVDPATEPALSFSGWVLLDDEGQRIPCDPPSSEES